MSHTVFLVAALGFAIGLSLGITLIYTRFCTMGAVADIALSQNYGRMRSWALAIVIAVIGTQLCVWLGFLQLDQTPYLQTVIYWQGAIVGGVMFGFGMVMACGCGARSLAMIGTGDLRAMVAVMVLGITAYMTMRGILSVPRQWLAQWGSLDTSYWLSEQSVSAVVGSAFALSPGWAQLLASSLLCVPLLYFIALDRSFLQMHRRLAAGVLVGGLVVLGWLATGWFVVDDFDEVPLKSLAFVAPIGDSLQYFMLWTGSTLNFTVSTVVGVVFGSFLAALLRGDWALKGFEDAREMLRYIGGGGLMGAGGVLAGGCTFGQGLTGMSTLALTSLLALASIVCGAFIGIRYLEQGSIFAAIRVCLRR